MEIILDTGEFEVMLSKGLGRHFAEDEKQHLFQDAKKIADLLIAVMDRRTMEEKEGKHVSPSQKPSPPDPTKIKQGLEELGRVKRFQAANPETLGTEVSLSRTRRPFRAAWLLVAFVLLLIVTTPAADFLLGWPWKSPG
jgi:hypothetical protein